MAANGKNCHDKLLESQKDYLQVCCTSNQKYAFHQKRIRPKSLEPFNFEKSNMSYELWCAEGFTQYYGELILVRAGLHNSTNFLNTAGGLINAKQNTRLSKSFRVKVFMEIFI